MDHSLTISEVQKQVDDWIRNKGVRYFNELTNTAILMEEVGELARLMARKYGEQSYRAGSREEEIADEIADVLWVVVCIANQTGVDLSEAFLKNMDKKSSRDSTRHIDNRKLH
jgi:NTP pyrophosphatase (non-canonical NTP hydrolase)